MSLRPKREQHHNVKFVSEEFTWDGVDDGGCGLETWQEFLM